MGWLGMMMISLSSNFASHNIAYLERHPWCLLIFVSAALILLPILLLVLLSSQYRWLKRHKILASRRVPHLVSSPFIYLCQH